MNAARKKVVVQKGGHIELDVPELAEGSTAEVIIFREDTSDPKGRSLRIIIGKGAGDFTTPEEADDFLRSERDSWI